MSGVHPGSLYASAAIGALFLGLGDLLNNQKSATVIKLAETIRQNLYPQLEFGGLIALILLGALSPSKPLSRPDPAHSNRTCLFSRFKE